ncbi:MAG: biopolymer transporter Tol, partial [Verrucomicrobiota bacterium]|nr:biopolymer transporter Tol [Verrucomicrobiota bacterium]
RRAFALHGGIVVAEEAVDALFLVKIEPASVSSVLLTLGSGQPYTEQLRRTVSGRDIQNAVLRACDIVVEATLQSKGFFAGRLAFVCKKGGSSELYISDLLFTRVSPLTADQALITGPKWSPDGRSLLFTSYFKSGFPDIYRIDVDSRLKTPVATFKGLNSGGIFSPDGRQIAMVLSGTGNSEIYVSNSRGKNIRRLTRNKSLETSPSWSPDGRRLVYTSDAPGKPQIYEISSSGGPTRRIPTNISSYCSEPVWNPVDENLIAFTAAVPGGFQVALYDEKKRSSEILTKGPSSLEPTWLRDGRHIVFTQRKGSIMRLMLLDTLTKEVSALHATNFGDVSMASYVY